MAEAEAARQAAIEAAASAEEEEEREAAMQRQRETEAKYAEAQAGVSAVQFSYGFSNVGVKPVAKPAKYRGYGSIVGKKHKAEKKHKVCKRELELLEVPARPRRHRRPRPPRIAGGARPPRLH